MQPSVTNVEVKFKLPFGYSAKLAPEKVPPIFLGERTIIYGILSKSLVDKVVSGSKGTVSLKGELLGGKFEHKMEFQLPNQDQVPVGGVSTIHHLAGKSLIKEYERNEGSGKEKKGDIVKLSCECGVISKYTAFIAIDEEQKEPVKGSLQTWDVIAPEIQWTRLCFQRRCPDVSSSSAKHRARGMCPKFNAALSDELESSFVPPPPPSGSGFISATSSSFSSGPVPPPPPSRSGPILARLKCSSRGPVPPPPPPVSGPHLEMEGRQSGGGPPPPPPAPSRGPPDSSPAKPTLPQIINLQMASGAWQLTIQLAGLLGSDIDVLKSACPVPCEGDIQSLWATALVLVFLRKKMSDSQDEWELVAMKAENWLKKQSVPGGSIKEVTDKAEKIM